MSNTRVAGSRIKLFVTATNVRTGRGRIFRNADITPDVLLASGCLPTLFQAVEIDGDPYWEGGYAGNPTLTPLVRDSKAQDTIQINPRERPGTPRLAAEILNRLNEFSFNATLMKMLELGYSPKMNAEWEFLHMLREEGRRAAGASLEAHADYLGRRSTADLDALLAEC